MPYSSPLFDSSIKEIVKLLNPVTVLDIGAGAGKYGELIKDVLPTASTTAIEIEADYIERFSLKSIYGQVWNMNVGDLISPKYYELNFDLVMIGDIIEHLRKSDGLDLINYLVYRSKWILIEFPHHYLQNAVDGYSSEAHISVWGEIDFKIFDATSLYKNDGQRFIVVKGYLDDSVQLEEVEKILAKYA
jgi:hypothetical protein